MIFRSVTQRLVFFYCLLLLLLGAAFMLVTIFSFRFHTRETISHNLEVRAGEIWNTAEEFISQPDQLAQTIERRFSPEAQDRFIQIRAGDRIIYQSGEPNGGDFIAADVPFLDSAKGPRTILLGNLLLHSRTFEDTGIGELTVATGQSYRGAQIAAARLTNVLLVGLPPLLLLAAIAGYSLMRRALVPVEEMITAAEGYTFNDPQKRLPLAMNEPRIEALGLALNRMLDRLDSAYSHVSRFSADAAHELRTPLTIYGVSWS